MSDSARPDASELLQRIPNPARLYPRGAGAPQQPAGGTGAPAGTGTPATGAKAPSLPPQDVESGLRPVAVAAARPQAKPPLRPAAPAQPSGFQRVLDMARVVMPLAQKLLPLLEGNVASAVSNVLAPRSQTSHPVSLAPIEDSLVKIRLDHREMRDQLAEQNSSLQRVADQLEKVKEATDRNTLEQQELMDNLHRMRKKVVIYAWIGLGLLAAAIAANVIVFLRIQRILP